MNITHEQDLKDRSSSRVRTSILVTVNKYIDETTLLDDIYMGIEGFPSIIEKRAELILSPKEADKFLEDMFIPSTMTIGEASVFYLTSLGVKTTLTIKYEDDTH